MEDYREEENEDAEFQAYAEKLEQETRRREFILWQMKYDDLKKENEVLAKKFQEATTDSIAAKVALQVSIRTLRMQMSERDFEKYVNFTSQYMIALGVMIAK